MTTRVLDFFSIMKTTQVLTREMDLPKLIEKMMLILLENATAEKGILFLEENGVMTPKALAEVDAVTSIHSKNFEDFPKTIIQKVIEIKSTVLIKNAVYDELSREDPYIKSNHNKSILCIPLLNLGDLRGLLYLENNSSIDAFKQEHTDILNMLSTQMAITLDNASFYKQLELKVEERTHALKDTQQQLIQKEKMAFLGMLTTGIAHEIKNPLNFIINFSQLTTEAAKELDDHLKRKMPEQYAEIQPQLNFLKDNTEHIYEQGQKANIIVNRMIEHSSQQSRQFVLTDIVNLIENSFKLSQSLLQKKYPDFQVALKKDFDPNVQYIKISNSDINQVMINLIDNAYDALFAKKLTDDKFEPIINIKTIHLSRGVEIHIKDNGIGIDAENQKRIFTPFFTTKPSGKGIGLGLSLCYNIIVSEHGGTLTYETKKGEFTEFILTIPHTPHLEEN